MGGGGAWGPPLAHGLTGLAKAQRQHCDKKSKKFTPYHSDFAVMSLSMLSALALVAVVSHDYAPWSREADNILECSKVANATTLSQCYHSAFTCICMRRNAVVISLAFAKLSQ